MGIEAVGCDSAFSSLRHEAQMQNSSQNLRRITHSGTKPAKAMSIAQYVDLVDRTLEQREFTPKVKKPPQPAR